MKPNWQVIHDKNGRWYVRRRRPLGGFTPVLLLNADDSQFIENIRLKGRVEPGWGDEPNSGGYSGGNAFKGMSACERYCRDANRTNSAFFNDDMAEMWRAKEAFLSDRWAEEEEGRATKWEAGRVDREAIEEIKRQEMSAWEKDQAIILEKARQRRARWSKENKEWES